MEKSKLETPKAPRRKTGGRQKGTANKVTTSLKEAILEAAKRAGDGDMVHYLSVQARVNPGPFMSLLGKVLPMQVTGEGGGALQIVVKQFSLADD